MGSTSRNRKHIFRTKQQEQTTNRILAAGLSSEATKLLLVALRQASTFCPRVKWMRQVLSEGRKDPVGVRTVRRVMAELCTAGYAKLHTESSGRGRIEKYYTFHAFPIAPNDSEAPSKVSPEKAPEASPIALVRQVIDETAQLKSDACRVHPGWPADIALASYCRQPGYYPLARVLLGGRDARVMELHGPSALKVVSLNNQDCVNALRTLGYDYASMFSEANKLQREAEAAHLDALLKSQAENAI